MRHTQQQAIKEILKNLSITELNEMQSAVIDKAADSKHLMLLSPTGTGKTLAFLIPLINQLNPEGSGVQALILAPSRELSLQIEQVFKAMKTSYKVTCCYGGHSFKTELNSLSEAPAVIIGTPGRLSDHIIRKSFDPATVKLVVLDEFDKSLQLGFQADLGVLFKGLSGKQHHILTSATELNELPDFLPFKKPDTLIDFLSNEAHSKLILKRIRTNSTDKVETLMRLVASFNQEVCLVFCNHRDAVERISELLHQHKFDHGMLHGAMEQIDREKSLIRFRGGAHNVLIATDLASRGLDIPEIKHVVHYQLPLKEEAFLHRNGRTARMHAEGQAYLILSDDETIPAYIDSKVEELNLSKKLILPPPAKYVSLYISAGKKDKISKGDVVGLLTKKGSLQSTDIGMISILDHASYVSVKRGLVTKLLTVIKNEKLKRLKVKIEIAS